MEVDTDVTPSSLEQSTVNPCFDSLIALANTTLCADLLNLGMCNKENGPDDELLRDADDSASDDEDEGCDGDSEFSYNEELTEEEEENDEESDDEFDDDDNEDTLQEKLLDAAREGDHARISKMVAAEGTELLDALEEGWSPLHWLAAEGAADAISVLVAVGANAAVRGADGETALHLAALNGHARACAALVCSTSTSDVSAAADAPIGVERAALLEARDSRGWCALHLAAAAGRGRSARALLLAGADVRARIVEYRSEETVLAEDAAMCAQLKGHGALALRLKAAAGSRGAGNAHAAWARAAHADAAASIGGLAAAASVSSAAVAASPLARLLAAVPADVVAAHVTPMWLDTRRGKWLAAVWPPPEGEDEDDVDDSEEAVATEIDAAALSEVSK